MSLFVPDGDTWVPTDNARSPWGPDALHGGTAAALIARDMERDAEGMRLVRLSIELLKPIPTAPLTLTTRTTRPGKKVQLVETTITSGGAEVTRAVGLRVRRATLDLPADSVDEGEPMPPPDSGRLFRMKWPYTAFHTDGMELRFVEGEFMSRGPAAAWFRLREPVVPDEEPSPFMRVAAAADFGNGLSQMLPMGEWLFINPDLTVTVHREPDGEWIGVRARTFLDGSGAGLSETELHDVHGRVGRGTQSLFVNPIGT